MSSHYMFVCKYVFVKLGLSMTCFDVLSSVTSQIGTYTPRDLLRFRQHFAMKEPISGSYIEAPVCMAMARRQWSIIDISPFEAIVKNRLLRCSLRTPC